MISALTCVLRRQVRRMLVLASATALLALLALPATAAVARPLSTPGTNLSTDLTCALTVTVDVHPGLSAQLHHLTTTSHGLTGTADCTGTVDGQPVTGPGVWGQTAHALVSCTGGSGTVNVVLKLPTASGTRTVPGKFMFSFSGLGNPVVITGDFTGTGTVLAANGDCVTTPITQVTVRFDVHSTT